MNTDPHDKIIALLKSVATSCDLDAADDHAWRKCRHCLAVAELERKDIRKLLAAFLESGDPGVAVAPPPPFTFRWTAPYLRWEFTDTWGDQWSLTRTDDPHCPLMIQLLARAVAPPPPSKAEAVYQQPVEAMVTKMAEQLTAHPSTPTLADRIAQWRGQTLTPTPAASDFERGYMEGRTFAFERCADEAELILKSEPAVRAVSPPQEPI